MSFRVELDSGVGVSVAAPWCDSLVRVEAAGVLVESDGVLFLSSSQAYELASALTAAAVKADHLNVGHFDA